MACIAKLQVEGLGDSIKLFWSYGPDLEWDCAYFVSGAELTQAGEYVRRELQKLANLRAYVNGRYTIPESEYGEVHRALVARGGDLRDNLFRRTSGDEESKIAELKTYLLEQSQSVRRTTDSLGNVEIEGAPSIRIILCNGSVHLPWGFVCVSDEPRASTPLVCNIADFADFWIGCFRLATNYQGSSRLPADSREQSECVYALHEDLFTGARNELMNWHPEGAAMFDRLLNNARCKESDWIKIKKYWRHMPCSSDNVLYVFGHSDGEKIILKDDSDSDSDVLPACSFCNAFKNSAAGRSASIVIFNGCRTAAPSPTQPWPPSFLKSTRMPGFFGFVGTETQIPNDLACLFGAHLLTRLHIPGQTLGEAFDALLAEKDTFPLSLVYSCFANREFRLSAFAQN